MNIKVIDSASDYFLEIFEVEHIDGDTKDATCIKPDGGFITFSFADYINTTELAWNKRKNT